jgi:hypothetical protein
MTRDFFSQFVPEFPATVDPFVYCEKFDANKCIAYAKNIASQLVEAVPHPDKFVGELRVKSGEVY